MTQLNSSYPPHRILFIVVLLLLFLPFSGRCNPQVYRVGPGDIICLTLMAGGVQQIKTDLVVSDQGIITVPFIGTVTASGQTLKELENIIVTPLERDFFVDPQVHIQIKEYHSLSFTISGAVDEPGEYELDFHPTILDLIAKASGVLKERGNIAYVLRENEGGNTSIHVDLTKLLDEGDMDQNIMLASGDKVYIPLEKKLDQSRSKVYLEGELKKPGIVDYRPGLTALSACIMAGGFGKYAAPHRARIIRKTQEGRETIKINLEKIRDGELPDVPLQPGDRIHIPETWL